MDRERDEARERGSEPPHDILAAEAFAMGEGDPGLHHEAAHDILAAEAFAMPAADRGSRHVPRDEHSDDPAPHDVLSAEEYAMPAGQHHALPPDAAGGGGRRGSWGRLLGVAAGLVALRAVRRRWG
ncbi:MAG TPA: hypothetical protein VG321_00895 [Solirubrobacteraceae bacterium]|nr:hypothetical protein [Solirubrobacteraceae bacterium]